MKLHELAPSPGSRQSKKRLGRGTGSGLGKTCGKGHKGQKARTGHHGMPRWFEGGQMPLQRRLPKRGFTNIFRQPYAIVNLSQLTELPDNTTIDLDYLQSKGLIKKRFSAYKVLGNIQLKKRFNFKTNKISASARKAVEEAKGSIEIVS